MDGIHEKDGISSIVGAIDRLMNLKIQAAARALSGAASRPVQDGELVNAEILAVQAQLADALEPVQLMLAELEQVAPHENG
jgi:hypothetical protein